MAWFPLVGLFLGALLAVSDLLFSVILADSVVNLLLIVVLVILTHGLHLDGLADTIDGIAGGRTAADRLAIMRDPHIGAIGVIGLILALGLRYVGLMALPQAERLSILICMPAVGRWAMVVGAVSVPYARPAGGLAHPFLQQVSARAVISATVVVAVALVWAIGPVSALFVGALVALVARGVAALASRLLGGMTGDTFGATNEAAELLFLVAVPVLIAWGPALFASR